MITPLLVLATLSGTLDLSDRTQSNLRSTPGQSQAASVDASTVPGAAITATDRVFTLRAGASASLMVEDLELGLSSFDSPLYFGNGSLGLAWRGRRAAISLDQSGTYGRQNTTYLAQPVGGPNNTGTSGPGVTTGPAIQLVPTPTVIQYGSYSGSLVGNFEPANRWRLVLGVGLTALGGLDDQSQASVPFLWGPNGQAGVYDSIDRHNTIFTLADGTHLKSAPTTCLVVGGPSIPCEPDSTVGEALLGWTHDFSLLSRGTISGGIAVARAHEQQTDPYDTKAFPAALASYEYGLKVVGHPTVARIEAHLAPTIDYHTGFADYRAQGTAGVTWTGPRVTLTGSIGAARSIEAFIEPISTMIIANAGAEYRVTRLVFLSAGLSGFWESQEGASDTSTVIFSVALTVHAPLARF